MILALLWRANLGLPLTAVGLGLGVIVAATAGVWVQFPLTTTVVPTHELAAVVVSVLGTVPLQSAFGRLEASLVRIHLLRLVRLASAEVMLVGPLAIAAAMSLPWAEWWLLIARIIVLSTAGLLGAVGWGSLAWALPGALGLLAVVADHGVSTPVSDALSALPPIAFAAGWALAATVYVLRGARES